MREDNMAAYADAIAAYRPEVVVAYVDPVFRLSKWLLAQGRTIRGVGVVLGAAEALHDFQRPIIEAAFPGSRAYNTYGCREFMLIACEAGDRNGLLVNATTWPSNWWTLRAGATAARPERSRSPTSTTLGCPSSAMSTATWPHARGRGTASARTACPACSASRDEAWTRSAPPTATSCPASSSRTCSRT